MNEITIRGARTHNLKNIDVTLPRDKFIVITGLSGSGKSSLAFDTLYAEGQRRYVESLSSYARQFLSMMDKPDVDHIEGLSPAISIQQKSTSHNPRSTVGTTTEIYDYLRLLYSRIGEPRCPEHGITLQAQTVSQMVDAVLAMPSGVSIMILAPMAQNRKGEFVQLLADLRRQGFLRARIDGKIVELENPPALDLRKKHSIEVIVDRLKVRSESKTRLAESFETALALTDGLVNVGWLKQPQKIPQVFSAKFACPKCGYSIAELQPRLFSFNSPSGACASCDGLGVEQCVDPERVITNPKASLATGAIRRWDKHNLYYFSMLESLAKHYRFSVHKPWHELEQNIRDLVLYGSGKEDIEFYYVSEHGRQFRRSHVFEGVIPNIERRYRETDSTMIREDLAKYMVQRACVACQGSRLRVEARYVFIENKAIADIGKMSVAEAHDFFKNLKLTGQKAEIATKILKEIIARLSFLVNVGLNYLSLSRSAETLSGGEAQRIRLASQIGSGLVGVMYILDEPSIGLHQRDNDRLLNTLVYLRDLGNTVIVVEHDEDAICSADYILDIGPRAGVHGGEIVAQGSLQQIKQTKNSLTGNYLSGKRRIVVPTARHRFDKKRVLRIQAAAGNNLKSIDVDIPLGLLTCITGVSGSGKSTLINDTLYPQAAAQLNHTQRNKYAPCKKIVGLAHLDKVVDIDQSPIGRTPRSNPATYTGMFTSVRELFAQVPEARSRGYKPGRFSFNVKGGRCEACQGDGVIRVEMHFLADVYVECELCKGKRYNRETLEIKYKDKNIHEVLVMTVEEALPFYSAVPAITRKLQTLMDVGLSYITLGQSATTLSGGEAQRIKLAKELCKRDTGATLYILDEPTTGLHFYDIEQLLRVLHSLRDRGNTIIIIEHNLDVIKTADWIIDLGPEGGDAGGTVVVAGTPEAVAKHETSYTGHFLHKYL